MTIGTSDGQQFKDDWDYILTQLKPKDDEEPVTHTPVEPGNIDLKNRPIVKNKDGSISTVRSMSFGQDGLEVLVPTVHPEGRIMSNEEAIKHYQDTGQHLGKFKTPEEASSYAEQLHKDQEKLYTMPPRALEKPAGEFNSNLGTNVPKVPDPASRPDLYPTDWEDYGMYKGKMTDLYSLSPKDFKEYQKELEQRRQQRGSDIPTPEKIADKSGRGSDMEGPHLPITEDSPYTPLTPQVHKRLLWDTPIVSSKGPNGGPTKEEVLNMLNQTDEELQQRFDDAKATWGKSLVNPTPDPSGRIRGWKTIPGFQELIKDLPKDIEVHDMGDGTVIFRKKLNRPARKDEVS